MEVNVNQVLERAQGTLGAQLMEIIKLQAAVAALETENAALKAAAPKGELG